MNAMLYATLTLIEMYLFLSFVRIYCKFNIEYHFYVTIIIMSILCILLKDNEIYFYFILVIGGFIYTYIASNTTKISIIIYSVVFSSTILLLFDIVALTITSTVYKTEPNDTYAYSNIISEALTKSSYFFSYLFFRYKSWDVTFIKQNQCLLFIMSNILMFCVILSVYMIIVTHKMFLLSLCITSLMMLLFFITCYYLFYIFTNEKNSSIRKLEIEKLQYYHEFSIELQEVYKKNRMLQHDLNTHFQMIYNKAIEANNTDIKDYLNSLTMSLENIQMIITKNKWLNDIINVKISQMKSSHIQFRYRVLNSLFFMEPNDIISLLGNLLDNAIQAQEYVMENKFIFLSIMLKAKFIVVEVINSFNKENLSIKNGIYITGKQNINAHGMGIKQIEYISYKYYGNVEIESKADIFKVIIIFPKYKNQADYTN